jgi:hypothetical protein
VLAPVASIQGAWYLVVLSVSSVVAIRGDWRRRRVSWRFWGSLGAVVMIIALGLLANVQRTPVMPGASEDTRTSRLD